jgi:hypothetical protein
MATTIQVGPRVADFVRERGGRLFVWLGESGIEHETTQPNPGIDFVEIPGESFTLFVDRSIEQPDTWRLVFHRFPIPHVRALWNGTAYQAGGALTSWEDGGWLAGRNRY